MILRWQNLLKIKNKGRSMINLSNNKSAVKQHYLSSIIPFNTSLIKQQQITKSRQFYKPEQLIWNNPHRTSQKIYPYYHQFNDRYLQQVKPKIEQKEAEDRKYAELSRIKKLTEKRNETRNKFYSKQQKRLNLEKKAGLIKREKPVFGSKGELYRQPIKRCHTNSTKTYRFDTQIDNLSKQTLNQSKIFRTLTVPQSTYQKSVEKYDEGLQQIRKMILEQVALNRDKIRQKFNTRRIYNNTIQQTFVKSRKLLQNEVQIQR